MPTILEQLEAVFKTAINEALGFYADPALSVSQNEKFGDYQANAAMSLAKRVTETTGEKTNPRSVAEKIKAKLNLGELASEVSIAGPGFINVKLSSAEIARRVQIAAKDERLGVDLAVHPIAVVVDYSGPNVAKQMHVGHLRSTIIGDAISRVIEFQGHKVIRQNHIGDWGTQFGRVLLAIWMRILSSALGADVDFKAQANAWQMLVKKEAELKAQWNARQLEGKKEAEPDFKDKAGRAKLVSEFAALDQKFVEADPTGEKHFDPGLDQLKIDLAELESLYQWVSGITDQDSAKQAFINHPTHGRKTLEELPRLVTRFLQNPSDPANSQERKAWKLSTDITLITCQEIYERLEVRLAEQDRQHEPLVRGESFYNDFLPAVVSDLNSAGIATESDGAIVAFVEGYSNPLIIQKSDGGYLYGTTDLAGIRFRINQLHANRLIYTHDSRQAQHFAQVFATAKKAGWANDVELNYAPFGTMLGEDGKPFKTRSGDTVKLRDLIDEAEERAFHIVTEKNGELPEHQRKTIAHAVGIAAIKYADLSKDRSSDYVFSWDQMLATEGNTGPYLLYAYARTQSIFRKATERNIPVHRPFVAPLHLESPYELSLAKHIARFGEVIEIVARELKPHHLCGYLYDLAQRFSGFFENCPVLQSEDPVRSSRLTLCEATGRTMALGLDLLGIEHPVQM